MKLRTVFVFTILIAQAALALGEKNNINAKTEAVSQSQVTEPSLFDLDQSWTDHNNKKINLRELQGLPIVATMTFASCPGACPLMISDIKQFDKQLSKKMKKKIRYATFSIDPNRDTPIALKKFYQKMKLDPRWRLFTSDADQARLLAAALGFSYKDLDDGDFTHSTSLYLISSKGIILARKERSADWSEFNEKLNKELVNK